MDIPWRRSPLKALATAAMGTLPRLSNVPYHLTALSVVAMLWYESVLTEVSTLPNEPAAMMASHEHRSLDARAPRQRGRLDANETFDEERGVPGRSFLTPELVSLVRSWEGSMTTTEEAKGAIWDVVRSESFARHQPSSGIVFIKTHKTGSSTITSILHSTATSHGLIAPLAKRAEFNPRILRRRHELLGLPTTQPGIRSAPYDVWCNHAPFHGSLLTRAVPSSRGRYFSIVRDPATRLRSACAFYGCCPAETEEKWAEFVLSDARKREFCTFDESSDEIYGPSLDAAAQRAMEDRVRRGDLLLLVTERMNESVLVLRDFYNLHPLDIAFLSQKVRLPRKNKEDKSSNLKLAEDWVREQNPHDTAIHALANAVLTEKMEGMFPQWAMRERAIKDLELLNDLVYRTCLPEFHRVTPELNSWCREKQLDNTAWNEHHLTRLKEVAKRGGGR